MSGNMNLRHVEMKVLHVGTGHAEFLVLVGQLHFHRHRLPVAADAQGDDATRRRLVDHPPQLGAALDGGAIHGQNNVMLFEAGLARWGILVDHRYFDALLFFQFQRTQAVGGHVGYVDSEIGTGAAVFAGKCPGLLR